MNSFEEDRSIYNGNFEVEIIIDRPVAQVWRQYVDAASWITTHDIEFLKGGPGIEGSVRRIAFKKATELSTPGPHFHYGKIVKAIPEQQQLVKTYTGEGGAYGMHFLCFDDARFVSLGTAQTKVIFNTFAQVQSEAVAQDPAGFNLDSSRQGMLGNLQNLKRMLESQT